MEAQDLLLLLSLPQLRYLQRQVLLPTQHQLMAQQTSQ